MSVFSSFNRLNNRIAEGYSNVRQTTQTVNTFSANVNRSITQFEHLVSGNTPGARVVGEITDTARHVKNTLGRVGSLVGAGGTSTADVGSAIRMSRNAAQGVGIGAAPPDRVITRANVRSMSNTENTFDWRVSISVPESIMTGPVLAPLAGNSGASDAKMIFPFNPTILIGHSANYANVHPTHTNYAYHAYENSQIDNYTITGEFLNENEADAKYWLACLHFLRTVTKMFYGSSQSLVGNPPPVCRLNGYGQHVLNNIPVVITNFTTDLPADVDYIQCFVGDDAGKPNFVPTQALFTVTCAPNYARRSHARFSLQDYASGKHIGGAEGFI